MAVQQTNELKCISNCRSVVTIYAHYVMMNNSNFALVGFIQQVKVSTQCIAIHIILFMLSMMCRIYTQENYIIELNNMTRAFFKG
jgi:hypothetical protein